MKKLLVMLITLITANLAKATTLEQIAGTYRITHSEIPVINLVTININGDVKLIELSSENGVSENKSLECNGKGTLSEDIFTSDIKCENNLSFTQKINLKNIKDFTSFSALVFSSLYNQELEMQFEKIIK